MTYKNFDTLSGAVNALTEDGYSESFSSDGNNILGAFSKRKYQPGELKIIKSFHYDGMTNPSDESEVFALEATDGTKGTLVMSYGPDHYQNVELIRKIGDSWSS